MSTLQSSSGDVVDYGGLRQNQFGRIHVSDGAKTYLFPEDGVGSIRIAGFDNNGPDDVRATLWRIARTKDVNDAREVDNGDGETAVLLDLFDEEGRASDDFLALVRKAAAGEGGLSIGRITPSSIDIKVEGNTTTDTLCFSGNYVTQTIKVISNDGLTEFAGNLGRTLVNLGNPKEELGVYVFDNENNPNERQYHGNSDLTLRGEVADLFEGSFLNEDELPALIKAALYEKYGIEDTSGLSYLGDDGSSLTIGVTTFKRGAHTDVMVLTGSDVEQVMDDVTAAGQSINTRNTLTEVAFYDTDARSAGKVFLGYGTWGVTIDEEGNTFKPLLGQNLQHNEILPRRDELDEFVDIVLANQGEDDIDLVSGGERGDDYLTVTIEGPRGGIDYLTLYGERISDAIDDFYG